MNANKNIEIVEFDGRPETINGGLADAYMRSYVELSKAYKTPEEMELYTYDVFVAKLERFAADKESLVFVLNIDGRPEGFVRYSPVPEYYKHAKDGAASEVESGTLDGAYYEWERKIEFSAGGGDKIGDNTAIVNQIYLAPEIQNQGYGTALLKHTLPFVQGKGYDSVIIEYNKNNEVAKTFYAKVMGLGKIADTGDLDHIRGDKKFVSPVEIGHNTIENAIESVNRKRLSPELDGINVGTSEEAETPWNPAARAEIAFSQKDREI